MTAPQVHMITPGQTQQTACGLPRHQVGIYQTTRAYHKTTCPACLNWLRDFMPYYRGAYQARKRGEA